jgi:NAD(P)-dependent dehydrogenase (short-subunit alcohol dehydrogenase family)
MTSFASPFKFSGKSVLVTGASSGIGRQTAITLSHLGCRLMVTARDKGRLEQTIGALAGQGHLMVLCDMHDDMAIESMVHSTCDQIGPLAAVVHCAGVQAIRPMSILQTGDVDDMLKVNVGSAISIAKAFRKKDRHVADASLIFLSSVMGLVGQSGQALYSSTKAALIGLVKSLSVELARDRIRVNAIAPGVVNTAMTEKWISQLTEAQLADIRQKHPLGLGEVEDVANAAAFLVSDASRWMTGTAMVIDGGYTAQ